jgi:hypothetical protein
VTDIDDLRKRLTDVAADIERWRQEASGLRAAMHLPDAATDDALLLSVEETSSAIYLAIENFDELVRDIDRKSHVAAGQIAAVGDALRLVLMEITELGTRLYALRSADPAAGTGKVVEWIELAASSNGDKWHLCMPDGDGQPFVEHHANEPSGGTITRLSIPAFLDERPSGPQHEALRQVLKAREAGDVEAAAP